MDLADLVAPEGIIPSLKAKSKKQALQEIVRARRRLDRPRSARHLRALLQRERLGSTGLGRGIAIPHVKFKALQEHRLPVCPSR